MLYCFCLRRHSFSLIAEQRRNTPAKHMSEHIPGPKSDLMPQQMSDFMAGNMSEHMPTRTSEHSPEHVPAFMIDDVSEHVPEQASAEHSAKPHQTAFVRIVCQHMCPNFFSQLDPPWCPWCSSLKVKRGTVTVPDSFPGLSL